ncbi:MAG: guanine deaminase [Leptolyngbyaceae cyanobacterium CAN_BIN12]|nr:guanine deaminase [Leptolyngbyaceae cyanobacterium CAN_BIN12]
MSVFNNQSLQAIRGAFLDFIDDPFYTSESDSVRYISDGLLIIENGAIADFGTYNDLRSQYAHIPTTTYPDRLIMPGFIDTHIHYSQYEMIAAYGEQLLEWLSKYVFPTEKKFKDKAHAEKIATLFFDELLKQGTTTALVFATVHPESVDAFFEEASRRNLRMISGKVLMDRNAPDYLIDTPETAYEDSKRLIEKWHKNGRLLYAVTPRFAPTSTPEQLHIAAKLLQEFPDVYMQTHISENKKEVAWVAELFPESQGYLDVYDRAGLVGEKSIFAHGVHLTDAEFKRLSNAKSAIAFCPTSNLFLGSGLFKLAQAKTGEYPVKVGFGTDVGAGTSFSILHTAHEAYKVAQLQGESLSAFNALYLATLGGAKALSLDDKIGNFNPGKEADFIVLDPKATTLMATRNQGSAAQSLEELAQKVFGLMMLGDDRAVQAVYIAGELAHSLATV